jgi:thioesterase domain-containing protein
MKSSELKKFLYDSMPLCSAMGINVIKAEPEHVILSAPLQANINHKKTAFGGSLHSLATLACFSLVHVNVNGEIVIAGSEVEYLAPVTADFQAECKMPDLAEWERFLKIFQKKGRARIPLISEIWQRDQLCVKFRGVFVAFRKL